MTSFVIAASAALFVLAAQAGAESPGQGPAARQSGRSQTPPAGWAETKSKALDFLMAGKDLAALAIYESWVARHPAFADGQFMLGAAHESVARALITSRATDARATRTTHFEAAAVHMRRGLELAGPDASFTMMRSLIDVHGVLGLDRPAEYERLVREGVTRYPTEPLARGYLLEVLAAKGESIEAAARAARAALPQGPEARVDLARALVSTVGDSGRLTPALGPALLPEASRLVDEALALKPGDAAALRARRDIQALQATVPGRPSTDEAGVQSALRAIASGQFAYAGLCGRGSYAPTLAILARPRPGETLGFVTGDLVPAGGATSLRKYGYRIEMTATPSPRSAASCHGVPAGTSAETFSVVARPLDGFEGRPFRVGADEALTDLK